MRDVKELENLKQEYEIPHMSERQVDIMKEKMNKAKQKSNFSKIVIAAAAAAALVILPNTSAEIAYAMGSIPVLGRFVEVVTFREYQHEDERNHADIKVPEIAAEVTTEGKEEVQENLQQSVDEINAEIQTITDKFVTEFKENLEYEQGYQNIVIDSEVIQTTQEYFTLKLNCYQGAGSGTQWNYYYTMDLKTGERLALRDLFVENADYITPISENIKEQMKQQMEEDENLLYWLDYEVGEWNFKQITDETEFYVNENGNIVISFNEGDVAPMYMGIVTFEIPEEVIADIRK